MSLRAWVAPSLLLGVALTALVDAALGGTLVGGAVLTVGTVVAASLVGAWLPPAAAAGVGGCAVAMLTAANQLADAGRYSAANDLFFFAVLVGGLVAAGELVSVRARQVRELRELSAVRAEQRARELEAARLEERTRIDAGVTRAMMQRMSALVVQAAGVRRDGGAHDDRAAVARVEAGGREALEELREVLGSLHGPPQHVEEEPVTLPRREEPAVGWLDVLVGCSGLPVAVECVDSGSLHGPVIANVVVGVALGVPLVWRRTRSLLSVALSLGIGVAMSLLLTPLAGTVTVLLPLSVAAYALGAHTRGRRRAAGVLLLALGGALISFGNGTSEGAGDGLVPSLVWLAIACSAGVLAGQHADRAARLADLLARVEAGREDDVRLAVAEQRQALAADLHDTVAHAMTVVCLHAEAVQQQWSDERAVVQSLAVIESAAREALGHLRTGLGVLETETLEPGAAPAHDLADEVRAFAGSLGVVVTVSVPETLTLDEHHLARRVVREALVNVARHAAGSTADVRVARDPERLVVEVTNPTTGRHSYASGAQRGLVGLRDLFSARGGTLEHGPTPEGGYAVTAYLPSRSPVPA